MCCPHPGCECERNARRDLPSFSHHGQPGKMPGPRAAGQDARSTGSRAGCPVHGQPGRMPGPRAAGQDARSTGNRARCPVHGQPGKMPGPRAAGQDARSTWCGHLARFRPWNANACGHRARHGSCMGQGDSENAPPAYLSGAAYPANYCGLRLRAAAAGLMKGADDRSGNSRGAR